MIRSEYFAVVYVFRFLEKKKQLCFDCILILVDGGGALVLGKNLETSGE